jgi:hypothetical protein
MDLHQGNITLSVAGIFEPSIITNNNPGALVLFSNYIARRPTTLSISNASSSCGVYTSALRALSLSTVLPGSPSDLLLGTKFLLKRHYRAYFMEFIPSLLFLVLLIMYYYYCYIFIIYYYMFINTCIFRYLSFQTIYIHTFRPCSFFLFFRTREICKSASP